MQVPSKLPYFDYFESALVQRDVRITHRWIQTVGATPAASVAHRLGAKKGIPFSFLSNTARVLFAGLRLSETMRVVMCSCVAS